MHDISFGAGIDDLQCIDAGYGFVGFLVYSIKVFNLDQGHINEAYD
ncbi:hypothetical protein BCU00_007855 [Vibrio breoganii]|nr:hypothetical protein [Vibrio breoganii]